MQVKDDQRDGCASFGDSSAHRDVSASSTDRIGSGGSRWKVETPALLIELDAMRRNIGRMADYTRGHSIGLRPHVKAHKSTQIAKLQIDAGAIGVSCATIAEAEVMVHAGIPGVLVTSPVVSQEKIERLIRLAWATAPGDLMVVVDHPRNIRDLAAAAADAGRPLYVLLDFAAGYGRTGARTSEDAVELARLVSTEASLTLRGLQAYAGNVQHVSDGREREAAANAVRQSVQEVLLAAEPAGITFDIVTGAGTGTVAFDAPGEIFTEVQPGSYVFMDAEYEQVLAGEDRSSPYERALLVQAAVVSTNSPDWVTVDGGTKCFATDAGVPIIAQGTDPKGRYAFFGDEHGKLFFEGDRPDLGARVEFVPPHCDPTVNLHDRFHVVDGDRLVAIWPIDARGWHQRTQRNGGL